MGKECPTFLKSSLKKIVLANNEFALKLYKRLSEGSDESICFCPLSLGLALGTVYHGARGSTSEGLRSTLGYDTASIGDSLVLPSLKKLLKSVRPTEDGYTLHVANKILTKEKFNLKDTYKYIVETHLQTSIMQVDFHDKAKIVTDVNDWVAESTDGKIEQLIDMNNINPQLVMLLLNAVYFQANWNAPFDPKDTAEDKFFNDGLESDTVNVEFMHRTNYFLYTSTDDAQFLKIPFDGNAISMLFILPLNGNGLQSLQKKLNVQAVMKIQKKLGGLQVNVSLPKFKVDFSQEISESIKSLGAAEAFDVSKADFSGMANVDSNIYLSEVIHKSTISVDEFGCQAAAATSISVHPGAAAPGEPTVFKANHPFMFQIVDDDTHIILFAGHVNRF